MSATSAVAVGVLTASDSLRRLADLVETGFRVSEITSTDDHVLIDLVDGHRNAMLRLGPEDAKTLLTSGQPKQARRIPAGPAP